MMVPVALARVPAVAYVNAIYRFARLVKVHRHRQFGLHLGAVGLVAGISQRQSEDIGAVPHSDSVQYRPDRHAAVTFVQQLERGIATYSPAKVMSRDPVNISSYISGQQGTGRTCHRER